MRFIRLLLTLILAASAALATPTIHIIGDSTVRNTNEGLAGWGDFLAQHVDPEKATVQNHAIGGRSSRSFITEGRWTTVLEALKPGDIVIVQFGHNDGGPLDDERGRGTIRGTGEETKEVVIKTDGEPETVHSYGWYLRKYASDAKAKGAIPIIVSPVPRNIWKDGKISRNAADYGQWAKEASEQSGATYIDLNARIADRCEEIGQEKTAALFTERDHTHTNKSGAILNAEVLAAELRNTPAKDLLRPAAP